MENQNHVDDPNTVTKIYFKDQTDALVAKIQKTIDDFADGEIMKNGTIKNIIVGRALGFMHVSFASRLAREVERYEDKHKTKN